MKADFVRKDSRTVRSAFGTHIEMEAVIALLRPISRDLVYVEYDVEVTASIRFANCALAQSGSRPGCASWVGCSPIAASPYAGFLFLRADEWTKGYLTSWLAAPGRRHRRRRVAAALIFI